MSDSVRPQRRQPIRLHCPWDSPGKKLERVAISFSNAWKWKVKVKSLSRVQLLATPWTAAYQAPPSMGFSRQEYWSGVPLPSPFYILFLLKKFFFTYFLLFYQKNFRIILSNFKIKQIKVFKIFPCQHQETWSFSSFI